MDVFYFYLFLFNFVDRIPCLREPSPTCSLLWMVVGTLGGKGRRSTGISCFFLFLLVPEFSPLISFFPLLPCLHIWFSPRNILLWGWHSWCPPTFKPLLHSQAYRLSCSILCLVTWPFFFTFRGDSVLPLSPLLLFSLFSLSFPVVHTHRPAVLVGRIWENFWKQISLSLQTIWRLWYSLSSGNAEGLEPMCFYLCCSCWFYGYSEDEEEIWNQATSVFQTQKTLLA